MDSEMVCDLDQRASHFRSGVSELGLGGRTFRASRYFSNLGNPSFGCIQCGRYSGGSNFDRHRSANAELYRDEAAASSRYLRYGSKCERPKEIINSGLRFFSLCNLNTGCAQIGK
jgi:hypothetical protein